MQKIGIEGIERITKLVNAYIEQHNSNKEKKDLLLFGIERLNFRDWLKTKNYFDLGKLLIWETNLMHWSLSESFEDETRIYPFLTVFEGFKIDDKIKNTTFYTDLHEVVKNISELNYYSNIDLITSVYKELLENINLFTESIEYDEKINDFVIKSIYILEQLFDYRNKLERFNVIYLYLKELNKNYLEKMAMLQIKNKIMNKESNKSNESNLLGGN